jgi:hypothetical protein
MTKKTLSKVRGRPKKYLEDMESLAVYLPSWLVIQIKKEAVRKNLTVSQTVTLIIKRHVSENGGNINVL